MAYVTDWACMACGKHLRGIRPQNGLCYDCDTNQKDRKRRDHFGRLDALTLEERVREIEEWIYAHSHDGLARKERHYK